MTASSTAVVPPATAQAGRRLEPPPRRSEFEGPPERAEGIELMGELAGSGYRQPPALARRADGQLVKLTPLLHHLVQSIDGQRTHDELGAELSRRIGKRATARDVKYLIERKLRPLGLVRGVDGRQPPLRRANPLLAVKPRIVVSRREWTNRLTTPFVWLFSPVVVVPMLVAFALVTGWLITDKGLAGAIHQAFYNPGLLLVVWGLVLLAAAFHEIGHASACRYGGARPGVMGAGLYLVWPTFYTEVSDAYRLDRRGRLRVDLGGLYFSAIFAVATVVAWALTGVDALLLVTGVQLLQMLRQLAPFVRADGYHVVADLIGVPDLFAHIKPTLLGLLPTRWGRPQTSALKPWARAVVALWVLLIVPVLAATLGTMVFALPRLGATAWDSMGMRWAETEAFWREADVAGVITSGASTGLVALPVLGILYLLARLGRRAAVGTWRTTTNRPLLRLAAIAAATMLGGLVAWAWWPGGQYQPIDRDEPAPIPTISAPSGVLAPQQLAYAVIPGAEPSVATGSPAYVQGAPATGWSLPSPTVRGGTAGNAGGAPRPAVADAGIWPFPFDRPAPPEPGDNRAMAVNTEDGSLVSNLATSLILLTGGDPVLEENAAHAYANCADCRTIAIAFQVILITGYANQIAPVNAAVAANNDCVSCDTLAFAYQVIATLTRAPDDELQRQLDALMDRLESLQTRLGSLTDEQIYLELEDIQHDVLVALEDSGTLSALAPVLTSNGALAGVTQTAATIPPATQQPADADEEPPQTTETTPEDTSTESTTTTEDTTTQETTTTTTEPTTTEQTTTTTSDGTASDSTSSP
jgi:putative peptide zinc metalloprotease protein